jgi:ribosomal protein S18 acetylase RimI-like enzyme
MAAVSEPVAQGPRIVDLRHLGPRELDVLLLEEAVEWQEHLDWDFAPSADLIRQFMATRALNGCALVDRGEVVGYAYTVLEDRKGLIGDLYVRSGWRGGDTELQLFRVLMDGLGATSLVQRVESQLMLVEPATALALGRERPAVKIYERLLMKLDRPAAEPMPMMLRPPVGAALLPRPNAGRFHIEPWADHLQESAANAIALAYNGHIDSQINDQYRSLAGARRFLYNIVQFPGCGIFYKPGSFIAFDTRTGWVAGIVLVSFVSAEVGHITQLCVTPQARGAGLGYELLRLAILMLSSHGAKRISLTVTGANSEAIHLYQRCSFEEVRRFFAYVWDRG